MCKLAFNGGNAIRNHPAIQSLFRSVTSIVCPVCQSPGEVKMLTCSSRMYEEPTTHGTYVAGFVDVRLTYTFEKAVHRRQSDHCVVVLEQKSFRLMIEVKSDNSELMSAIRQMNLYKAKLPDKMVAWALMYPDETNRQTVEATGFIFLTPSDFIKAVPQ